MFLKRVSGVATAPCALPCASLCCDAGGGDAGRDSEEGMAARWGGFIVVVAEEAVLFVLLAAMVGVMDEVGPEVLLADAI